MSWVATDATRRAAGARVTSVTLDAASVLLDGPWNHRLVSANGARFHVAELGDGPMVLLMHGFPQFWYTWRHQMAAIADAGWRAVAMDLRGYGASDKPPRGYSTYTGAEDAASLIRVARRGRRHRRRPGPRRVHRVVHAVPPAGRGPRRRVAVDAAPADHAARVGTRPAAAAGQPVPRRAAAAVRARARDDQGPRLRRGGPARLGLAVRRLPDPGGRGPLRQRDGDALRGPLRGGALPLVRPVARSARTVPCSTGASAGRSPCRCSSCRAPRTGASWPTCTSGSADYVSGPYAFQLVDGAGHFLTEEAPDRVSSAIVDWLDTVD